jgi:uncharacterized membrane protein
METDLKETVVPALARMGAAVMVAAFVVFVVSAFDEGRAANTGTPSAAVQTVPSQS